MAITGAIIGDISGSQYEFDRAEDPKTCPMFSEHCFFTDDTVMTLAIKYAVDNKLPYVDAMHIVGNRYPGCGYGGRFYRWIVDNDDKPYNSWGNGSAMRVSYIGEYYDDLDTVIREAEKSAAVTHNHPEGIKGAVVTATCIWMARHGKSKQEIHDYVAGKYQGDVYKYHIDTDMQWLIDNYTWDVSCQGSVPIAMKCFVESSSYEDFLRRVYALDCDADTLGAIGGAVAEEYYGTTGFEDDKLLKLFLDEYLYKIYSGSSDVCE